MLEATQSFGHPNELNQFNLGTPKEFGVEKLPLHGLVNQLR